MTANHSLCHYPSISSKDNEAPPWLPWKLFKSDGAKIRFRAMRKGEKRVGTAMAQRSEIAHIPLMNAFLVDSLSKLSERPLRPSFPAIDRFAPEPLKAKKGAGKPAVHKRWRSTLAGGSRPDASILRPTFSYQRANSELSHAKRPAKSRQGNYEAYGRFDISKWSNDGGTPKSVLTSNE